MTHRRYDCCEHCEHGINDPPHDVPCPEGCADDTEAAVQDWTFPAFMVFTKAGTLEYVEDFARAWQVTLRDPEGRAALETALQEAWRDGHARGGLSCCGTTSAWHRPWCHAEPRRYRAAPGA